VDGTERNEASKWLQVFFNKATIELSGTKSVGDINSAAFFQSIKPSAAS
jgi:hypothetical protein